MTIIPVIDRFAVGWPAPAGKTASPVVYAAAQDVFAQRFEWDAHFSAYSAPTNEHRLTHKAIGTTPINMVLLVVDVEPEGHTPRTDAWDESQSLPVQLAIADGAYFYATRGGYRLVWTLSEPFPISSLHDAERWKASYLAALDEIENSYNIVGDRSCKDWTRLYRLPFVVRDGVKQEPETSDVATMGTWSLRLIDAPVPERSLTAVHDGDAQPASPELLAHVQRHLTTIGPARTGERNAKGFHVACVLVRGYALPDDQACTLLEQWNESNPEPIDVDELRTLLDNAYNYGQGDIGDERREWEGRQTVLRAYNVTPAYAPAPPALAPLAIIDILANIPPPATWVEVLGGNLKELATSAQAFVKNPYAAVLEHAACEVNKYMGIAGATTNADERPFFESAASLFAGVDKPPTWRVHSLLLDGGIGAFGAEPKAVKTWAGTEVAIACATGTPAFGKYKVEPCNTAYFYTEDMRDGIKARVRGMMASRGLPMSAIDNTFHAQPRGRRIDVTKPDDCARIIASVRMIERRSYGVAYLAAIMDGLNGKKATERATKAAKVGLVVLDPLRNIHMFDEDKSGEMAKVFENLKMIGTVLGCTIVIVHHSKKQSQTGSKRGGQKLRGSGAIHGFLDSALYFSDTVVNDDNTVFTNTVESETKSGQSAGRFELTLTIKDDPITRSCTLATWTIGSKGETTATEDTIETWRETAADIVDAFYENKMAHKTTSMTVRALKTKLKGRDDTRQAALKTACQQDWLRQDRKTQTYHITPAGEAFSRERHEAGKAPTAVNVPPSESGHPAANYLQD